jgi:RNA polymerase sigma factor (sigma-70 family)
LNLDYLRTPERFGSWWCGIVLNHARRHLTASRRQVQALVGEFEAVPADDGAPGPEDHVERAEISHRVREAVAALPPGQRSAAYRFYLQGLSYREAADELGITVNTLKARLHQGRQALRRSLDDLGPKEKAMSVTDQFVPVEIVDVRQGASVTSPDVVGPHIVVLKATESDRVMVFFVSAVEGTPLAMSLEEVEMPRPMTHQLATRLVAGCGGEIVGVSITRLVDTVYYATVSVATPQGTTEVDARPSDALNLAALTGAPITVESSLLSATSEDSPAPWTDLPGPEHIARQARERHDEMMRVARARLTAEQET